MDSVIRHVQDKYVPAHSWFIKYKLYHLPFWFLYHTTWFYLNTGSFSEIIASWSTPYLVKFSFYVIFQAAGVYLNLYLLIPRLLDKGKYRQYVLLLALTIGLTAAFIASGYYLTASLLGKTFQDVWGRPPSAFFHFYNNMALPSTIASMTLAMSFKFAKKYISAQRRQQALEKEHLETELKFLKSQFNPHFLFNTINSIFVLINKNPKMASESLAKFSELLRYQLYECNEQEIVLQQELTYLENFIELEKLRHDHHLLQLSVQIRVQNASSFNIAPFMLMPFVENAFKHVSRYAGKPNWININMALVDNNLDLEVSNSVATDAVISQELVPHGGIGLKNIQRRLDLIYPSQHELTIIQDALQYKVKLHLNLSIDSVASQMMMASVS